jgi:hypothetical protein
VTGQFGMFPDRESRDAWVAQRDREIDAEAATLAHIGIAGPDDLCDKYGYLCHLYETGELPQPGEIGLLTSDDARAFADKMLVIMHGGPWRYGEAPQGHADTGFQAAFLTDPAALVFSFQSYTADVDPAGLFSGEGNTAVSPSLDVSAADRALAATGYARATEWSYTDDIWGAVVRPTAADGIVNDGRPGRSGSQ